MSNTVTHQDRGVYIDMHQHIKCPRCLVSNAEHISYGFIDFDDNEVYRDAECSVCGHNWTDTYTLSNTTTESTDTFKLTVAVGGHIIGKLKSGSIYWKDLFNISQISEVSFDTFQEYRGYIKAIQMTTSLAIVECNNDGIASIYETNIK